MTLIQFFSNLEPKDWLVIASTLLGPILAVQAQKAVETFKEKRSRKIKVFQTLMATRAARLSPDHVQALNMIDLVFYGKSIFGIHHRSKNETLVIAAWREYHDHLSTQFNDESVPVWSARCDELMINLLYVIANDVGYSFDRVQLKKGSYSPVAHGRLESEQETMRKLFIEVLSGERPIAMDIQAFPINESFAAKQTEVQEKLAKILGGEEALSIKLEKGEAPLNGLESPGGASH